MNVYFYFVLSASALFYSVEGVKVSLYYEALCSDSTRFIARQLYPNYSKLKNHIELDLIPYGKAIHVFRNNRWVFDCQHGPNECKGNKYQSCALAQNNGQDKDIAFVNCVMREANPANLKKMQNCATRVNIDWSKISTCATTNQGDNLLVHNGNRTFSLEPNLSFVPTVVYDDKFDDYLQEQSLIDFTTVVCSRIKGEKPQICNNRRLPERRSFADYFL